MHFETDTDPIDVHLDRMQALGDGTSFDLTGHIVSTNHKDKRFRTVYHLGDRSGVIEVLDGA